MTLERVLGRREAAWIVAGNMIGAGIFLFPGPVAGRLPGLAWPLVAWALGGALALCGAAVYGELGSRLPRAGGDYQYLAAAFGPLWGFLHGWAAILLTFSAAAAVMAVVAVRHVWAALAPAGDPGHPAVRLVPPLVVLLLTWANTAGVRAGERATVWLTALPLAGLFVLFGAGVVLGRADLALPQAAPLGRPWPLALGSAMVFVFFTYSGWNAAAYLAGEIRDPGRNLAGGLLWGTALVTAIYLAFNLVVLLAVPPSELAGTMTAGAQAADNLLGPGGARALGLIIALSVLGSANVTLMAGARVYYAMARDGLAPAPFARLNAAGAPAVALWVAGAWTALLAVLGFVEALVTWATLAILLLSALATTALFVLRRRDGPCAGFRCPGYPWTPLAYAVASLGVAAASAAYAPRQALQGLALVAAGLPLYGLLRWRRAGPGVPGT